MKNPDISLLVKEQFTISNLLETESHDDLVKEILQGLQAKQKFISSRFFYDHKGSMLFEEITRLPEYYLTYTEKTLLRHVAPVFMNVESYNSLIELGSGDDSKISILLDALPSRKIKHLTYYPVDVSESAINKSAIFLSMRFPELKIHGILADFIKHITSLPGDANRLICFFGSTIGNLDRREATELLTNIRNLMQTSDSLLIGMDMEKDILQIEQAYNDCAGLTAVFNRNILHVINNIAGTDFEPCSFNHKAFYNHSQRRIEMHLEAMEDMVITSRMNVKIAIRKGETIHTENSHKFNHKDIQKLAQDSGLQVENIYTGPEKWFSLVQFGI